jgi:hypothetical protein
MRMTAGSARVVGLAGTNPGQTAEPIRLASA